MHPNLQWAFIYLFLFFLFFSFSNKLYPLRPRWIDLPRRHESQTVTCRAFRCLCFWLGGGLATAKGASDVGIRMLPWFCPSKESCGCLNYKILVDDQLRPPSPPPPFASFTFFLCLSSLKVMLDSCPCTTKGLSCKGAYSSRVCVDLWFWYFGHLLFGETAH